jgi:predicted AAA+ superfamily ATPase
MEQLEAYFAMRHRRGGIIARKTLPQARNLAISGPPGSGKTHLLLDRCRQHEGTAFYLDLADRRLDRARLAQTLPAFIADRGVTLLALDGWHEPIDLSQLPCDLLIAGDDPRRLPPDMTHHRLWPLDFEEFLAFQRRADDPEGQFADYLRLGGLPEVLGQDALHRIHRYQERLTLMLPDPISHQVYGHYLDRSGFSLSPHQAYTALKRQTKISKDKLYRLTHELIATDRLIAIDKYDTDRAPQKLYGYDFALRQAVTFEKAFSRTFEAMVSLELIKQGRHFFYADYIDCLLPDESRAVIALPFPTPESLQVRLSALGDRAGVERIEFVTMGFSYQREELGRVVEAVPFWEWALREAL